MLPIHFSDTAEVVAATEGRECNIQDARPLPCQGAEVCVREQVSHPISKTGEGVEQGIIFQMQHMRTRSYGPLQRTK